MASQPNYTDHVQEQPSNPAITLLAKINLGIGQVKKHMEADAKWRRMAYQASQPVFYEYSDQVVASAAGFGVIRLTGPDQGHVWLVRAIVIADTTVALGGTGATAGAYILIKSAADARGRSAIAQFPAYEVQDLPLLGVSTIVNPAVRVYSNEQIVGRFNEEFFVVVNAGAGASGHQFMATIRVLDVEEAAYKQEWAI